MLVGGGVVVVVTRSSEEFRPVEGGMGHRFVSLVTSSGAIVATGARSRSVVSA